MKKIYYKLLLYFFEKRILNVLKWPIKALYYHIQIIILGEDKYSLNIEDTGLANKLLADLIEPANKQMNNNLSEETQKKYNKLYKELQNDKTTRKILLLYYQIKEYYFSLYKLDIARIYSEKAKELDNNSVPIKDKNDFRKAIKEIKTIAKEKLSEKKDLQTFKISISISEFLTYISLVGTLFIVTGFLKNYFYYKAFGFDITPFFGIEDYLATSIKSISSIFFSSVLGLIAVYLGLNSRIREPESLKIKEDKRMNIILIIIVIILISSAIFSYLLIGKQQFQAYNLLYILIILSIIPKIAKRYFKNAIKATFILIFLGYYMGSFIINHFENISATNSKYDKYQIKFDKKYDHIKIIGINTRYVFTKDTCNKEIIVIPISEIKEIKILNNRP